MRLFVAIELSDDARMAIAAEQERIAAVFGDRARALRFVRAEHLHLTLVFIGDVAEDRAAAIIELMQHEIAQPPFRLVFGGLGRFPPHGAPRILWLGALEGANEAIELQAAVAGRLAAAGVPPDERPFRPHLTLARWRGRARSAALPGTSPSGVVATVDVRAVTLFQSRLSAAGSTYTALAHARLLCP